MNNGIQMINDHRPVDTYYNGVKIAGSETKTFTGTSLSIADTYNDYFHELTLTGRYEQATPTITNPVHPTFSGDCMLTVGGDTVEIPTLRATPDYADSYNILTGQHDSVVHEGVFSNPNAFTVRYINHHSGGGRLFSSFWISSQPFNGRCVCSHFPTHDENIHGNYFYPAGTQSFFYGSGWYAFVICHPELGLTTAMTEAEQLTVFRNWMQSEINKGTPPTAWVNKNNPTTTQLTPQAPRTAPYQTNITDNGVLACDKTATLKVFWRTE